MKSRVLFLYVIMSTIAYMVIMGDAVAETPEYTLIKSEPDFEIRHYRESKWVSALVQGTSFETSTKDGFHRLYQYIHGDNLNSTGLTMTAPVLTSVKQLSHGFQYLVSYYVPAKYEDVPPQPSPELHLQVETWKRQCVAVSKFTGFAKDDNVDEQVKALVVSLRRQADFTEKAKVIQNGSTYSIAQYTSPHRLTGRLNEVWINVAAGFTEQGCPATLGKIY